MPASTGTAGSPATPRPLNYSSGPRRRRRPRGPAPRHRRHHPLDSRYPGHGPRPLLAEGAERGDSPTTIAQAIEDLLTDATRAEMIATTELCRAISQASLRTYQANGIERIEWASAGDGRVCPICQKNADGGARRPGSQFPSGQTSPPGHPWCRCALVPVTGGS
ncbi:phage minor head protein [Streptomyces nogalater]